MREWIITLSDGDAMYGGTELIRCMDCERNPRNNGGKRVLCPCPMDRYMGEDGFCSKAEPKEKQR